MMAAFAASMVTVFWWVYRESGGDEGTVTLREPGEEDAPEFTQRARRSRITRTRTPRLAAAARSCSAVVSENSYMVTSMLCRAPLMRRETGEKPAPGSTISGPDLVTPEVPAWTAPEVGAAPETWILQPVAASSTTARDAAAGRALRRNMDGILLSGARSAASAL